MILQPFEKDLEASVDGGTPIAGWFGGTPILQCEAPKIAFSWCKSLQFHYGLWLTYNYSYWCESKPTSITGVPLWLRKPPFDYVTMSFRCKNGQVSVGSLGHPNMCRRPCVYVSTHRANCPKGSDLATKMGYCLWGPQTLEIGLKTPWIDHSYKL